MSKELTPLEVSKQLKDFVLEFVKNGLDRRFIHGSFDIIETSLKRIDYLERVNKDLQESKDKLIEERNNKIIEHRIVYDDYNFQSIKKFVACKGCQYYENEKCSNTAGCFWLDLEKKLEAIEIIKNKPQIGIAHIQLGKILTYGEYLERIHWFGLDYEGMFLTHEEFDLLKEVLL